MKQPENNLATGSIYDPREDAEFEAVCIGAGYPFDEGVIAIGRTKQSAIKAAKRRLQRLIRGLEKLEQSDTGGG